MWKWLGRAGGAARGAASGVRLLRQQRLLSSQTPPVQPPGPLNWGDPLSWLAGIDTFIFDCDGVLWRSATPIEGSAQFVQLLQESGKRTFFVTNNSTVSRDAYVAKMRKFNIPAAKEDILSSAFVTAQLLAAKGVNKVFVVGEQGIREELQNVGMALVDDDGDLDPDVQAVVVGLDRQFDYRKLSVASGYLRNNPPCLFAATNEDRIFPADAASAVGLHGHFIPGSGSLVAAVAAASGRLPDLVGGKPSPHLLSFLRRADSTLSEQRTCMVGDRLDTDIQFGNNLGLQTLLVFSGVTPEDHRFGPADPLPSRTAPSLGFLWIRLESAAVGLH